ncbi:MAG: M20/M25/M40 family metallo-hydrolase [Candidatus Wallbacteria bacterium]|nr:M20/M25/M40 family metallo-hydrolase [Candidatus Wallbacteria bacterium]
MRASLLLGVLIGFGAAAALAAGHEQVHVPTPEPGPALSALQRQKLAEIDWAAVREEAAALLSAYVQVPSVTGTETAAAEFLERAARARGFRVERLDGPDGRPNVLVSAGPEGPPGLLLLSHLDVVPASADGWSVPPFSGLRKAGAVWGRGSIDNKGLTVMQLLALALLEKLEPAYPHGIALLSVSDEEAGGTGAQYVLAQHAARFGKATVLGEGGVGLRGVDPVPPYLTLYPIATAEKTSVAVTLSLDLPSSGHGSIPPEEYATRVMVKALGRLLDARMPMRMVPDTMALLENLARYQDFPKNLFLRHPDWSILKPILDRNLSANPLTNALVRDTLTLTGLETQGGGSNNTIPTRVIARLDCRLLPGTPPEVFLLQVKDALKEPCIQIAPKPRSAGAVGTAPNDVYAALEATLHDTDKDALVTPFLFPASSDNNFFRAAGHPVFGFLPCRLEKAELDSIHGKDERLRDESLEQGIRVLTGLLLRLR